MTFWLHLTAIYRYYYIMRQLWRIFSRYNPILWYSWYVPPPERGRISPALVKKKSLLLVIPIQWKLNTDCIMISTTNDTQTARNTLAVPIYVCSTLRVHPAWMCSLKQKRVDAFALPLPSRQNANPQLEHFHWVLYLQRLFLQSFWCRTRLRFPPAIIQKRHAREMMAN